MSSAKGLLHWALALSVSVAAMLLVAGCEKESATDVIDELVQGDIFPVVLGTKLTFNGFLRAYGNPPPDTNITATGAVYLTTWTVASLTAPVPPAPGGPGGTAIYLIDSTRVPTGIPSPPTIWMTTPVFIQIDASGSFSYLSSIGAFYRALGISRQDTLKWIKLADKSVAVGGSWTAYSETFDNVPSVSTAKLEIIGKWEAKETITVNGTAYETYKLTTSRNVYLPATATTPAPGSGALTASVWIKTGVGPVRLILNADTENYGHFRELVSRAN